MTEVNPADKYVRLATPADYAAVDELVDAAYRNDYGDMDTSWDAYRTAAKRAAYPLDIWVVCRAASDEVIGTISSRKFGQRAVYEETPPGDMDLRLLATSPRARREGIGQLLLEHVTAAAKAQGFSRIMLKTDVAWEGAQRLYHRLGWQRFPERDGIWDSGERSEVDTVISFAREL